MDQNLHDIEHLFRDALDDNGETASRNVWEAVEKRLDKDNIIIIKRKYAIVKRIAILLFFLLLGFVLFDVYHTNHSNNNNGLTKNKDIVPPVSQNQPGLSKDKSSDRKNINNETVSALPVDTITATAVDKENLATEYADYNKRSVTIQQQLPGVKENNLPNNDVAAKINAEKNRFKEPTIFLSHRKKNFTGRSAVKVKIKNAVPVDEEPVLTTANDEQPDNTIPLRKRHNTLLENVMPLSRNRITIMEIFPSIAASETRLFDSVKNAVTKNVRKKPGKPSRFSITPFFSPDIAWYRLENDDLGNQQDNATALEKEEKHEFSSTYGALVDYKINKHWGLQSGLTLSNTNITVNPKTIYAQQDNTGSVKYRINTSSGYGYVLPAFVTNPVVGDSLYAFTSTHFLQYISVPLVVIYALPRGKFKFNVFGGVSLNILTKATLETTVEKGFNNTLETVDKLQGVKKLYFSGLAGFGADYKLTNKIALTFAPALRFALTSINKDAPVKSYPTSFGFTTGLKIGL